MTGDSEPARASLLAGIVSERTELAARATQKRFDDFRMRLSLEEDAVAAMLYLTWLRDEGASSRLIARQFAHLELLGRMSGRPPWRAMPELRDYLRGLFRDQAMGSPKQQSDPLYREHVQVLVDAIMSPTPPQLRARAAALLAHRMNLDLGDIWSLRWKNIEFGGDRVTVSPPRHRVRYEWRAPMPVTIRVQGGPLCTVNALRRWREQGAVLQDRVFLTQAGVCPAGVRTALQQLALTGDVRDALRRVSLSPIQLRDRLAILLGYGAALSPHEAASLRQGHIAEAAEGLLVQVPGRRQVHGISGSPGMPGDIVDAWNSWIDLLRQRGAEGSSLPALMPVRGDRLIVSDIPLRGLSRVVERAAIRADMTGGHYTYGSLRWGMIRTGLRADQPIYSMAQQASLGRLSSVLVHHHREHLITKSVAGQLGL